MILDIEGKEINVGDECYQHGNNKIYKIIIVKETPKSIHYRWSRKVNGIWSDYTPHSTYLIKSSLSAKHLIKVC